MTAVLTPGRRRVAGLCLILAPLAFTASELAFPETNGTTTDMLDALAASPATTTLAIAAMGLTTVLFMPAMLGLLAITPARGSALTSWGA